jgi:hypothetical protein
MRHHHFSYPVGVLFIYTLVATIGFGCNIAVISNIFMLPMNTPNVRYVLILTTALFLEQIFAFPQVYVRYGHVCSASGALETYFELMMLCAGVFMAILAYCQLLL